MSGARPERAVTGASGRLAGEAALVTGATRGIGLATARLLLQEGCRVAISARKPEELAQACQELEGDTGGQVVGFAANAGSREDCRRLVQQVMEAFSRLDILVNNAATNPHFGPLLDVEPGAWEKTLAVNLEGPLLLIREAHRAWMGEHGGRVVNVSSVGGASPAPGLGVYNLTKAALNMLTRQLALELGPDGVLVNAVAPGVVRTAFAKPLVENAAIRAATEQHNPLRRFADPEDVARVILFLVSDPSSYVNGAVIPIDAGYGTGPGL